MGIHYQYCFIAVIRNCGDILCVPSICPSSWSYCEYELGNCDTRWSSDTWRIYWFFKRRKEHLVESNTVMDENVVVIGQEIITARNVVKGNTDEKIH
jgi:hypothetical protein